ncbi:MAG: hypothetical protein OXU20_32600 [Myxococcales bacterium]|nr:hypothetical protein [Myxococcales bacterium]
MELKHARVRLKLHTLKPGEGEALLLLHALGGEARDWDISALGWPGPVHGLDFAGHGHSGRIYGGAYHVSLWAADADSALAALERAVLVGAGAGAYAALLVAGARPEQVPAAVLMGGTGLAGGGAEPDWDDLKAFDSRLECTRASPVRRQLGQVPEVDRCIEFAEQDFRPPDYTDAFARAAQRVVLMEDGEPRPPWWESLRTIEGVQQTHGTLASVLQSLG